MSAERRPESRPSNLSLLGIIPMFMAMRYLNITIGFPGGLEPEQIETVDQGCYLDARYDEGRRELYIPTGATVSFILDGIRFFVQDFKAKQNKRSMGLVRLGKESVVLSNEGRHIKFANNRLWVRHRNTHEASFSRRGR